MDIHSIYHWTDEADAVLNWLIITWSGATKRNEVVNTTMLLYSLLSNKVRCGIRIYDSHLEKIKMVVSSCNIC